MKKKMNEDRVLRVQEAAKIFNEVLIKEGGKNAYIQEAIRYLQDCIFSFCKSIVLEEMNNKDFGNYENER